MAVAGSVALVPAQAVTVSHNPTGRLDAATAVPGRVTMAGWSLDRDQLATERVVIWEQRPASRLVALTNTAILRRDVNAALKVTGNHGWSATFAMPTGSYTFCAYAINAGPGSNVQLGCKALAVPAGWAPTGSLQSTPTITGQRVTLTGWSFDRDDLAAPERIAIYQRYPVYQLLALTTTTIARPDVDAAYKITGNHGWSASFTVPDGQHTVCAYGINAGGGSTNTLLGCLDILTPDDTPAGPVTAVTATTTANSIRLGWTEPATGYYTGIRVSRTIGDTVPGWSYPTMAELTPAASSFTDAGLVPGVEYTYSIFTHDTLGNHATATIHVSTDPAPCSAVCAWGGNTLGAGNNAPSKSAQEVPVSGLSTATQLAGGDHDGYALLPDGTVRAWGVGLVGQLGDGDTDYSVAPIAVPGLSGVTAIAAGGSTAFALRSDGTVWGWGSNNAYQLGWFTPSAMSLVPVQIPKLAGIVAIAAGQNNGYALGADGTVWAWGATGEGALGGYPSGPAPVRVAGLTGVTAIAAGRQTGYAVRSDGTLWAWGDNTYGEMGTGSTGTEQLTAAPVPGLTGVSAVSAAGWHVLALHTDGTVSAWGHNNYGDLGSGLTADSATPMPVVGLSGITQLASGFLNSYALGADGSVRAWGDNSYGQLGLGVTTASSAVAVQVSGLSSIAVIGASEDDVFAVHS